MMPQEFAELLKLNIWAEKMLLRSDPGYSTIGAVG